LTSVRTVFAVKVVRLVSIYCNTLEARKASKYAAVLVLSAVDPVEFNRKLSYRHLQVFSTPLSREIQTI
jgi:hypothetical protein